MITAEDNLSASACGCYSASRAVTLSGVPQNTVHSWAKSGLVVPFTSPLRETLWSFQDLLTLRAMHWLRQRTGAMPASPMHEVRSVLEQTVQQGFDPWNDDSVHICVDLDGRIFLDWTDELRADVHRQSATESTSSIDLLDGFDGSPSLVRPTPHVRIAPARLSGEPHVLGTRIGTLILLALIRDGYDHATVARLYDLPEMQVREAVQYEMDLAA